MPDCAGMSRVVTTQPADCRGRSDWPADPAPGHDRIAGDDPGDPVVPRGSRRANGDGADDPRFSRISNSSAGRVRCAAQVPATPPGGQAENTPVSRSSVAARPEADPETRPRQLRGPEGRGAARGFPGGSQAYRSSPVRANRRGGHAGAGPERGEGCRHRHQTPGHPGRPGGGTSASAAARHRRWNWREDASARDGRGRGRSLRGAS